jgi:AraC-like DNA-binding protein
MTLPWLILVIVSSAVGSLLLFALLMHKENRACNRLFAGVIFIGLINQYLYALKGQGLMFEYPMLIRLRVPLQFIAMALFYLYVRTATGVPLGWNRRTLVHFLPFLLYMLWYPAPLFWPALIEDGPLHWRSQWLIVFLLQSVCAGYFVACFMRMRDFERELRDFVSQPRELTVRWLKLLLTAIFILWSLHTLELVLFFDVRVLLAWRIAGTAILCILAAFALHYSPVFAETQSAGIDDPKKLPHETLEKYRQELLELFHTERPYLNAQLKLSDLADRLRLKPYQVSQVLNRGLDTNFYDFVNRHRVEEAKNRLENPAFDHLSIEGIGAESGFNSKSSFAVAFKKWAGQTPSAVRTRRNAKA